MDSKEHISDLAVSEIMPLPVPPGTLLFSFKLSIGKMAVSAVPLHTNEAIAALPIRDARRLDRDYLRYALMATSGAAQTNHAVLGAVLNKAKVQALPIPMRPYAEQRRVVDLLSRAENIVRMRREAEAKAKEIIPALFVDMFGDPGTNPKGWQAGELGDFCKRITDGTHQSPAFQETGIPFLFISNIVTGQIEFDTKRFVSEETYAELTRRCPIEVGDILYSTVGSYGVPVKVDTLRRFAFQRHIAHLKPDTGILNPDFLVGMLLTPSLKSQANGVARGVAQKTVNLGDIKRYRVILPPKDVQDLFAARVTNARELEELQAAASNSAILTFQSLLAGVFGEGG